MNNLWDNLFLEPKYLLNNIYDFRLRFNVRWVKPWSNHKWRVQNMEEKCSLSLWLSYKPRTWMALFDCIVDAQKGHPTRYHCNFPFRIGLFNLKVTYWHKHFWLGIKLSNHCKSERKIIKFFSRFVYPRTRMLQWTCPKLNKMIQWELDMLVRSPRLRLKRKSITRGKWIGLDICHRNLM